MISLPDSKADVPRIGEPPLARSAGAPGVPPRPADPIAAGIDLMEAVEALCPQWPPRQPSLPRDCRL
jgi:hypothetical protein